MTSDSRNCPMSSEKAIARYFIENRSRLIDLAAYLDRIERTVDSQSVQDDSRLVAFRKAIEVLVNCEGNRVERIQEILSDLPPDSKKIDCC